MRSEKSPYASPLETAVNKLKKRDQSLWGKIQLRSHSWLARLETHPLLHSFGKGRRRQAQALFRSEPGLDLDSLLILSLLFHLLLFFLLTRLNFSPPLAAKDSPVTVRILDLGEPAQEAKKEVAKKAPRKTARPQPAPPLPRSEKQPDTVPPPKPVPALPGPKELAALPRDSFSTLPPQSAEALVQLPRRQPEADQPSVATQIEALPTISAEAGSALPEALRKGTTERSSAARGSADLAALTSPDFAPYLEMIKKRVQSVWKYPEGVSGVHKINVVFVLDRAGKLVRAEVSDSTDPRLSGSAVQAMKTASPFPPIPESLRDLAGWPLRMRFTIDFGVKATR